MNSNPARHRGRRLAFVVHHEHDALMGQLTQLQQRVRGLDGLLRFCPEDVADTLEDCREFAQQFLWELHMHFVEEEQTVFPFLMNEYPTTNLAVTTFIGEHRLLMTLAANLHWALQQLTPQARIAKDTPEAELPIGGRTTDIIVALERLSFGLERHREQEDALFEALGCS